MAAYYSKAKLKSVLRVTLPGLNEQLRRFGIL